MLILVWLLEKFYNHDIVMMKYLSYFNIDISIKKHV